MTITRYLIMTMLVFPLFGCVTETVRYSADGGSDDIGYYVGDGGHKYGNFYDAETGAPIGLGDQRRELISTHCNLEWLETVWNCEWVDGPEDHQIQITIDRRGELVPFFPESERQCVENYGLVRNDPQYDAAYLKAYSEYETSPRLGNTMECADARSARIQQTGDLIKVMLKTYSEVKE